MIPAPKVVGARAPGPNVANTSKVTGELVPPILVIWHVVEPTGESVFPVVVGPQSVLRMGDGRETGVPPTTLPGPVIWTVTGRLNPFTPAKLILAVTDVSKGMLNVVALENVRTGTPIWKL